ncbi:hypothetical protein VP01_1942g1, partial [Puccinia sorghi]
TDQPTNAIDHLLNKKRHVVHCKDVVKIPVTHSGPILSLCLPENLNWFLSVGHDGKVLSLSLPWKPCTGFWTDFSFLFTMFSDGHCSRTETLLLDQLITNLVKPGIALTYYGKEQDMYLQYYLCSRQAMSATWAWKVHGCYRVGSEQYYQIPFDKALDGCKHTGRAWIILTSCHQSSGHNINQIYKTGSILYNVEIELPMQQFNGSNANTTAWMLYSNLSMTKTFQFNCCTQLWISAAYPVESLIYIQELQHGGSQSPYYLDGMAPCRGCLQSITKDHLGLKVLVLVENWVAPLPQLVHFNLGHNAQVLCFSNNDSSPVLRQQLCGHGLARLKMLQTIFMILPSINQQIMQAYTLNLWTGPHFYFKMDLLLPNSQFPIYLNLSETWHGVPCLSETKPLELLYSFYLLCHLPLTATRAF